MSKLQKLVINCETGVSEYIDLSDEEIAEISSREAEMERVYAEREAEQTRISGLKESARAKLVAGESLTAEEAAVIVL